MLGLAVRCGGGGCGCGGAGAYLTAQRTTAARSGAGRSGVLAAGTGARGLSLRVSFSPNSHPHRVGTSCPWPVVTSAPFPNSNVCIGCVDSKPLPLQRCSPGPSPDLRVSKKKRDEAWDALKTEIGRSFRPHLRNLGEIFSLRSPYDLEDYQIGMLFGAFLGCVGCYQLWKTAPSIFVDAFLAFIFYKLSVVSSELHRNDKSNSLITRLKFGTILIMVWKDIKKNYVLLDVVRLPIYSLRSLLLLAFSVDRCWIAGPPKIDQSLPLSGVTRLALTRRLQVTCPLLLVERPCRLLPLASPPACCVARPSSSSDSSSPGWMQLFGLTPQLLDPVQVATRLPSCSMSIH
ncbi:hypothetical protein D1007_14887 [Hordeum vulgare]|nr:hypothetical protein D1007_14887 [Hordeum vulgare]